MKMQFFPKQSTQAWLCICGTMIPKKDAKLSGTPGSHHGLHIHCPICGKIVASFVNPKETQ
jgi:hypothetical protein